MPAMDVQGLEKLLRKPTHTEEECAQIFGLIDFRVHPGSLNAEPPLSALIYAVQGILLPVMSFNHVPDLLDILSQVERMREFSREHAKWALIWQRFYETRPDPNVRVLQRSDKETLKNVLKPESLDATRRVYVSIVEHIIRQHVLHLWTHADESYLLHHYLRIYFPWAHGKPTSQRLYHTSLAPEEQARLAETGLSCFRFMRDAKLWEEQRLRELDVSILPDSYYDNDQSFQDLKFKLVGKIDIADIVDSITLYLKKVRGMEQRLEHLLVRDVP